jgi:hypothetical protein
VQDRALVPRDGSDGAPVVSGIVEYPMSKNRASSPHKGAGGLAVERTIDFTDGRWTAAVLK